MYLEKMPYSTLIDRQFIFIWAILLFPFNALAQEYIPNVVVVQFEQGISYKAGSTIFQEFDRQVSDYQVYQMERVYPFLDHVEPTPKTYRNLMALRHTYYVRYRQDVSPEQVSGVLHHLSGVVYSEPLVRDRIHASEPNDPQFRDQTELRHLRLPEAWDIVRGEQGATKVVIAIVDSGTDWRHEDLEDNVWINENEIPDNGVDDDGNGFIDDVHGVNFPNGDPTNNDPSPLPGGQHGTNSGGFAGAVTDNDVGIAGAAWNAEMMYINAGCPPPVSLESVCFGYEGVLYAAANGADIINTSWGGIIPLNSFARFRGQSLELAMDMGTLIVGSAGNNSHSLDLYRHYPARHPRVLSVGSTEKNTRVLAGFSNYGSLVNVFAPGEAILTTGPDNSYNLAEGTSFSAPIVSGVAALVKTKNPDWTPDMIREQIRLTSENMDDQNPAFVGETGRGFVNALAAVQNNPSVPAVRVKRWEWIDDDGDRSIAPGDAVTVTVVFINYLLDASQLEVGLIGVDAYPFLNWVTQEKEVGVLVREDSVKVNFEFRVASDAPVNQRVRFFTQIQEGEFMDQPDMLSLQVNQQLAVTHQILSELYRLTRGDSWTRRDNWNISTVPSSEELDRWYGIKVIESVFAELNLAQNNLNGPIPPRLGGLTQLWRLRLSNNSLSGVIPPELGNLSQLRYMSLSNNSFEGQLPFSFGNLSEIEELYIFNNDLSGEIPSALGNLSQVQLMSLSSNSFSGEIPSSFGDLSKIERLSLANNSLSGQIPPEFGKLSQMQDLLLQNNRLTREIPQEFGNLTELRRLNLSGNSLSGPLPSELGNLTRVQQLIFFDNELSGEIPPEFGNLTQLRRLNLSGNNLSGEVPSELGKLSILQELLLNKNELSGEIPPEFGQLNALTRLYMDNNNLSGEIPAELGNLTNLEILFLNSNSLSGEVPSEFGNLKQIKRLYLDENPGLRGELPRTLIRLRNLNELFFTGTALCAPQDSEFQGWLRGIGSVAGATCTEVEFSAPVGDKSYPMSLRIQRLTLPEATGNPPITYTLSPALPEGLIFDPETRSITGTPTEVMAATTYTYEAVDATGISNTLQFDIEVYSQVVAEQSLPKEFVVQGNYPNPFRYSTNLVFDLPWPARVQVEVLDILGRQVFVNPPVDLAAGWAHRIELRNITLPSGPYLYRLTAISLENRFTHVGRLMRIR